MNQPLVLTGDGYQISLTKEALKKREDLLKSAVKIVRVDDKADEALAYAEAQNLGSYIKGIESTRKAVKQPVIDLGKKIDNVAADAVQLINQQFSRIKGLLEGFQLKQAAEKRKIEEELRRKQAIADEELRKAEAARLAAEKKQTSLSETKAEMAQEKAIDARVEVMQLKQESKDTKAKGGRMDLDFEVIDDRAFYDAHPELCTIIVKTRETKEHLKLRAEREKIEVPQEDGLRVFLKPSVRIG